jgi:hypothetical protein
MKLCRPLIMSVTERAVDGNREGQRIAAGGHLRYLTVDDGKHWQAQS